MISLVYFWLEGKSNSKSLPKEMTLKKLSWGKLFKKMMSDWVAFPMRSPDIEPLLSKKKIYSALILLIGGDTSFYCKAYCLACSWSRVQNLGTKETTASVQLSDSPTRTLGLSMSTKEYVSMKSLLGSIPSSKIWTSHVSELTFFNYELILWVFEKKDFSFLLDLIFILKNQEHKPSIDLSNFSLKIIWWGYRALAYLGVMLVVNLNS